MPLIFPKTSEILKGRIRRGRDNIYPKWWPKQRKLLVHRLEFGGVPQSCIFSIRSVFKNRNDAEAVQKKHLWNPASSEGAEKPENRLSTMIPKVKQNVANWNPKGTTSEPNADRNASKHRCCSKNTLGEVRDEGLGTLWAPLGRFGLPFCPPPRLCKCPKINQWRTKAT